jgi:flagellin-like hook-associated protein FlgL
LPNGQLVPTNVTLQQAFNINAANGSPSVFQMLIRLRDTLDQGQTTNESSTQVNLSYHAVTAGTTIAQLESANSPLSIPLASAGGGNVAFTIASSLSPTGTTILLTTGESMQNVVAAINAASTATGVVATFNYQTQRLALNDVGNQDFLVSNVATGPGIATSNFTNAFLLGSTGDVVNNLSTQLGDIDNNLTVSLTAAGQIGATVQTVSALSEVESSRGTSDTQVQSNLEDTDIAKVTSEFTLSQTALQAAYQTTTRLEEDDLFDYLGNGS